jgi:lipoic acid synthetase
MSVVSEKIGIYPLRICDCGLADYRDILEQQHELHDKRLRDEIPDTILIVEHPAVITLGARQSANSLRTGRESLKEQSIDVVDVRRGGGATAHNPGQVVFYPILNLRGLGLNIGEYIRKLEETGIELLEQLDVRAERRKGLPGLWAGSKKIASIGVRISKSVTCHGMAINIQNDLGIFDHIVPCGLDEVKMTSVLNETGREHLMSEIKEKLSQLLIRHFSKPNEQRAAKYRRRKLPAWLKRPLPAGESYNHTKDVLSSLGLETICDNANCPNRGECWARGTATVLLLGNVCTRRCRFCSVASGRPRPPDPTEPARIAEMTRPVMIWLTAAQSISATA